MLAATNISENTQFAKFAKYNSTPKFVDLQYLETQAHTAGSANLARVRIGRPSYDVVTHHTEWLSNNLTNFNMFNYNKK